MKYNWPDRIKLISVNIILNVITGMFVTIFLVSLDFAKSYLTSFLKAYILGYVLSVLLTLPFFLKEWNKLRRQEDVGELPDMQDMRNISPRQLILFMIGLPLLVTSYVLYQFDNKQTAILCFVAYLVLWGIETVYVRKRAKNIIEGKNIK
jgi:hypothetical protein